MSIRTSRTNENAAITIDYLRCSHCALCVQVCKDLTLISENGKVIVSDQPLFGCIGCGQCVAVCPLDCISISGREISMEDFALLPPVLQKTNYDALYALMYSRRSIRDFKNKEVPDDIIEKILNAAQTAPMGIPPSDVYVMVLNGKEKVSSFSRDMIDYFRKLKKTFSPRLFWLISPFMKKNDREIIRDFVFPLLNGIVSKQDSGEDWLLYGAPLGIYFYNSPYADTVDAYIAATYAMLAAESLGLGSCMIGSINPFLEKGGKNIREKYGLTNKKGIMVIFGYPKYKYKKGIKRTFAAIDYN
jgi:nitroreductase/Pyruvate/2-oxoacid:ferredoxin oxidoreductase delta subunit